MNILLVDDDRFVLAALKQNMDWTALGFSNVYTAGNISQAKDLIKEHDIDILVTDIDMPQGTGLDLLAWIRENGYEIITIILTNYADFSYAQKAIALQSLEYYLKPIEFDQLTRIIKKAIDQVVQGRQAKKDASLATIWEDARSGLSKHFWDAYLKNGDSYPEDYLLQQLEKSQLPYQMSDTFFMVLFEVFPYSLSDSHELFLPFSQENRIFPEFEFLYRQAFHEVLSPSDILLELNPSRQRYIAIFSCTGSISIPEKKKYLDACQDLIVLMKRRYKTPVSCYLGRPAAFARFHTVLRSLEQMLEDSIPCRGRIFSLQEYVPVTADYAAPNAAELDACLNGGNADAFLSACDSYLRTLTQDHRMNHHILTNFRIDITQLVYSFLKGNGILAHRLLHGKTGDILLEQAAKSLEDMNQYLSFLVHTALDYIAFSTSQKSVASIICDYIDQHYADDINRNSLAEIVYLDPDYTGRLFKKEIGTSLGNYIIQKRISVAKDLLINTDLPVNFISDKVGYGNYSYFTKLFKKETDFTPVEYRKEKGRTGNE